MAFTKLFSSILDSTIWSEPDYVRILWITMLAMSDKYGEVSASIPGLARRAGITVEQTEDGIKRFMSPDQYSRTPDFEGRRISVLENHGGWLLLNHGKYRALMSAEERKEYNRLKQAERRARLSRLNTSNSQTHCQHLSLTVNDNQQCQHIAEAEAEAEADKKNMKRAPRAGSCASSKPSIEEMSDFAIQQKFPGTDGEALYHALNGKGWRGVKNWQSTFHCYRLNGWLASQKNGTYHNVSPPKAIRTSRFADMIDDTPTDQ